jgi:hypothetical protein
VSFSERLCRKLSCDITALGDQITLSGRLFFPLYLQSRFSQLLYQIPSIQQLLHAKQTLFAHTHSDNHLTRAKAGGSKLPRAVARLLLPKCYIFTVLCSTDDKRTFMARAEQPLRFTSAASQPASRRAAAENPVAASSQQLYLHAVGDMLTKHNGDGQQMLLITLQLSALPRYSRRFAAALANTRHFSAAAHCSQTRASPLPGPRSSVTARRRNHCPTSTAH